VCCKIALCDNIKDSSSPSLYRLGGGGQNPFGLRKILMKKPEVEGIKYNIEEGGSFTVHKDKN
jgi:hypothetical protein